MCDSSSGSGRSTRFEGQVDEITKEDLHDYDVNEAGANVEWMNRQLYLLLAATLGRIRHSSPLFRISARRTMFGVPSRGP